MKRVSLLAISVMLMTFYVLWLFNKNSTTPAHRKIKIRPISKNNLGNHLQTVKECSCSKISLYPRPAGTNVYDTGQVHSRLNSSCSDEGTFYQTGQNVVSFSLFLDDPKEADQSDPERFYREGLLKNLEMIRKFYPGYSARLYTNKKLNRIEDCEIICSYPDVFWCYVKITPSHGDLSSMEFRSWRFLPLGDPTVDVFLSRDLDSIISARDAAVVQDWLLKADKAISLMRDLQRDHDAPILGGMWEASNNMLGMSNASSLREEIIKLSKMEKAHARGEDQLILNQVMFYPRAKDIVAYDSYSCVKWGNFTAVRPFPIQRKDRYDFVGNYAEILGSRKGFDHKCNVCPVECRPEHGKDWTYC